MARKLHATIETRTNRLKLTPRRKPYGWTAIVPRARLGYRRNIRGAGTWVVVAAVGGGKEKTERVGTADDFEDATDEHALTFWQAVERGRQVARRLRDESGDNRPATFSLALDTYRSDLIARDGDRVNASRVRRHLPPALLVKPVSALTAAELRRWRDDLSTSGLRPGTVERILRAARACLTLAANLDKRITDRSAWKIGLAGFAGSYTPINRVLADADVLRLVAESYVLDPQFGLFVDVLASTGTRTSQACGLLVADLQADRSDPRLMLPSSRKGRGRRTITRKPVPISTSLARKLKAAAGDRDPAAPLLTRSDGRAWNPRNPELVRRFAEVAQRAGISCTAYGLRHSSIVRSLLAGVPARVVASSHDTSTTILERVYSAFISNYADAVARRGLLDTAQPSPDNVVSLPGRR